MPPWNTPTSPSTERLLLELFLGLALLLVEKLIEDKNSLATVQFFQIVELSLLTAC